MNMMKGACIWYLIFCWKSLPLMKEKKKVDFVVCHIHDLHKTTCGSSDLRGGGGGGRISFSWPMYVRRWTWSLCGGGSGIPYIITDALGSPALYKLVKSFEIKLPGKREKNWLGWGFGGGRWAGGERRGVLGAFYPNWRIQGVGASNARPVHFFFHFHAVSKKIWTNYYFGAPTFEVATL